MLSISKNNSSAKNFQSFTSKQKQEQQEQQEQQEKRLSLKSELVEKKDNNIVPLNLVGETRHYPPANKEWSNSVYAYNKSNLKSLAAKDNMAKILIKNYFNLSMDKTIARSKRMRSLIRKSTVKKLFVSSPEIKQTNDKVIITVYTFDRERQSLLKKLYLKTIKWERLKRKVIARIKVSPKKTVEIAVKTIPKPFDRYDKWRMAKKLNILGLATKGLALNMNKVNVKYIRNRKQFNPKKIVSKYKPLIRKTSRLKSFRRFLKKRYLMFLKKRKRIIKKKIPYFGFKHYNFLNLLHYTMQEKYAKAKRMLLYNYMLHLLYLANIKVHIFEDISVINKKKQKKLKQEDYQLLKMLASAKNTSAGASLSKKATGTKKNYGKPAKHNFRVKKAVPSKKIKSILIKKNVPFYVRRSQEYNKPYLFNGDASARANGQTSIQFLTNDNSNKSITLSLANFTWKTFEQLFTRLVYKMLAQRDISFRMKQDFSSYSKKYFLNVFHKSLFNIKDKEILKKNLRKFNKDVIAINDIVRLFTSRFKFGKLLLGLKILISKIYNKKTELNIVNLKSPHLNTDIFTEAVAIKLKKRVGLLRVMRRSLQLVKLPYKFKSAAKLFNVNKLEILNLYRSLRLTNLKGNIASANINNTDYLQAILKTLYSRSLVNQPKLVNNVEDKLFTQAPSNRNKFSMLNKVTSVLNTIKYKWATGVRLEAAGRLTRRYSAARSVFKFRHKGSLKNTDYSRKLDFLKTSMPNVMLRNLAKSNSQHSFLDSKKRIGAYGLKTWISSY